jgi:uncharacterized protein (DUF488 family)
MTRKGGGRRLERGDLDGLEVLTVGHSTRSADELIRLLRAHAVELVVDVRRFPASRRLPQFGRRALGATLVRARMAYAWLPALGGRRPPRPDSPHRGWRNASFRGYADHMESAEFAAGAADLVALARHRRSAVLCAEAVWWRCHRGLIADHLKLRGAQVLHVADEGRVEEHPWTPPARIVDGRLAYPADDQLALALRDAGPREGTAARRRQRRS